MHYLDYKGFDIIDARYNSEAYEVDLQLDTLLTWVLHRVTSQIKACKRRNTGIEYSAPAVNDRQKSEEVKFVKEC